jgi:hypothetical protein
MHRGTIAAKLRVIETRQIVMDQGCAMQQFDGGCGRLGERRLWLAAARSDREAKARTDPRSTRENSVADGCRQTRWTTERFTRLDRYFEGLLDSGSGRIFHACTCSANCVGNLIAGECQFRLSH